MQLLGAVLLTVASLQAAAADDKETGKPVWDFGLGVGAVSFADYRGADTTHVYVLPVPYLYYRGKFLKADRNGIRGKGATSGRAAPRFRCVVQLRW